MDKSLTFPRIIFGTSCLGNLYRRIPDETKDGIVDACLATDTYPVVFDSAGKYGAGLALESLGKSFEPGVWDGLEYDAEQRISAEGILDAYSSLARLKAQGKVSAIGIGAKDWRVIRELGEKN